MFSVKALLRRKTRLWTSEVSSRQRMRGRSSAKVRSSTGLDPGKM
jgi:hypothetical protein